MTSTASERFRQQWDAANGPGRLDLLTRLSPVEISAWAAQAPDWLLSERESLLAAAIIKAFGGEWPADRLDLLASRLHGESASVRQAALAALTFRAPQVLRQELPSLLMGDDPAVRVAAIRGLAAIDLHEALAHLEAALGDANPEVKGEGLKLCLVLPFAQVKSLVLRFVAAEADPEFIERVGVLFSTNPDLEVPFRLWEVAEQSPGSKKQLLKKIINNACEAIRDAGILTIEFGEFRRKLEDWIQRRIGARFVQDVVARLDPGSGIDPAELDVAVRQALERPHVHAALTEALHSWHLAPDVRGRFAAWLGVSVPSDEAQVADLAGATAGAGQSASMPAKPPTVVAVDAPIDPLTASPELRCHWLAGRRPDEAKQVAPTIRKIIDDAGQPVEVRASALRAAARLELRDFVLPARSWVRDADERLVSASLEYLGKFAADDLLTIIGRFLKMPSARIKAAALKVLRRFDSPQAVSTLMAMLGDKDPEGRAAAMSCLIHFDFSLVRLPLTELLQANPQDELLREALCLFASNPDPENLYSLYVLERSMSTSAVPKIRSVRQQCEQTLIAYGRLDPGATSQRERDFQGRWQAEQARKAAPPPPYALKSLRPGAPAAGGVTQAKVDDDTESHWAGGLLNMGRKLIKKLTD